MAQITCKNLSIGYNSHCVIKDLNFSLNSGDYLCIIGENGSGKSTLMKTLLGLQKPLSGEIFMDVKANEIGYVPQQTETQKDFPASVWEVVLSGCQGRCGLRPFYNSVEKKIALNSMSKMKILEFAKKSYRELSGGQQQRVLLARAFCAAQKILFLDEPVAGLDPETTSEMYKIIFELNQEEKITIIMISHDVKEALKYSSHVLELGNSIYFGTARP